MSYRVCQDIIVYLRLPSREEKIRKTQNILEAYREPSQTYYNCTQALLIGEQKNRRQIPLTILLCEQNKGHQTACRWGVLLKSPLRQAGLDKRSLPLTILLCEQEHRRVKQQQKTRPGSEKANVLQNYRDHGSKNPGCVT